MIPGIEEILHMLLSGQCTQSEALNWINRHIEMASESDGLRDHFAAKVCASLLTATSADHDYPNLDYKRFETDVTASERIAGLSYKMADAMLKARTA